MSAELLAALTAAGKISDLLGQIIKENNELVAKLMAHAATLKEAPDPGPPPPPPPPSP